MRVKKLLCPLAVALAFAATAASAQQDQRGWYGGVSAGQSKVKFDDSFPGVVGATASSVSKDETDTAWKLYVGYQLNRNIAFEGGWTNLGKWRATRNVTAPAVGSLTANVKSQGFHIDAVGILPLQNFALFAKLGGIYAATKTDLSSTGAVGVAGSPNRKKSEFDFKWGLGASYAFTRNLAVRGEFERINSIGDSSTGEFDVNMVSIGVTYRF